MTFSEWFEAQHGKRERGGMHISDEDLRSMARAGRNAERELQEREEWDSMRRAALYAWNVKDGDKA